MIFIIDYGAGNLHSVKKALNYLNVPSKIITSPKDLKPGEKVILPGVGAFGHGINSLHETGFYDVLQEHMMKEYPIFGICLGMQLLLSQSQEMGTYKGLNAIDGNVERFDDTNDKVPQIGWNAVEVKDDSILFKDIPSGSHFYFVHSYFCAPKDSSSIVGYSSYAGKKFCAAIEKNSIFAVQFHPEKSAEIGLKLLQNYAEI